MRRTRWALGLYQGDFLEGFLVRHAPGFEEWHTSARERFFVLLIQGLSTAVCMPAAAALTVEEGRKFGMGSTMSMFFLAMAIGQATGPIIAGGIADWLSINSVFYFGAAFGLTGTALFAWFTRGYRKQ